MNPTPTPLAPKTILAVAAHPDDLEFGASGSIAKWIGEGATVHYLICTDASKGSSNVNISSKELIEIRRQEQREACDILGVSSVTFLDYEDGMTEPTMALKRDIAREIRRCKPDTVVTTEPTRLYDPIMGFINHSDHRAIGLATMDAVYPLARDHLSFPELYAEGFLPHNVADLLFIGMGEHTFTVDITATYDKKLAALAAHKSQVNIEEVRPWLDSMSREVGRAAGVERAEGFIRVHMSL